jgi:hypothetical protein
VPGALERRWARVPTTYPPPAVRSRQARLWAGQPALWHEGPHQRSGPWHAEHALSGRPGAAVAPQATHTGGAPAFVVEVWLICIPSARAGGRAEGAGARRAARAKATGSKDCVWLPRPPRTAPSRDSAASAPAERRAAWPAACCESAAMVSSA